MPHLTKIQNLFGGHDLASVQAYTGPQAAMANQQIGAEAYAMGNKVAFRSRHPDLYTTAHETAHVIQQQAGVRVPDGVGRAGDAYERQADRVGRSILHGRQAESLLPPVQNHFTDVAVPVVQKLDAGYIPYGFMSNSLDYSGLNNFARRRHYGDKEFTPAQKAAIATFNVNHHVGAGTGIGAPIGPALGPWSDEGLNRLLTRQVSSDYSPEIDHIVKREDGGANDERNARVLSKHENNSAATTRSTASQKRLVMYDNITLTRGPNVWMINDGDILNLAQMNALLTYAGQPAVASWADADWIHVDHIISNTSRGTNNGVVIA